MRAELSLVTIGLLFASSCSFEDHLCEDSCDHHVSGSLTSESGTWPSGTYQFAFMVDGSALACTLQLPSEPPRSSITAQSCDAGLTLSWLPNGKFEFTAEGQPTNVGLVVTRDGDGILDQQRKITWSKWGPEGADCGPRCGTQPLMFTAP